MSSRIDALLDRSATGRQAALVKGEISHRLAQQEKHVLDRALAQFRSGLLTTEQARDVIAQVSALRDLAQALDKAVTQGTEATAQLVSPGRPNGGQR